MESLQQQQQQQQLDHTSPPLIVDEVVDSSGDVGEYIGQVKWFQDKRGYGFVTICVGEKKGMDVFVHHSGIRPLNSVYKTLRKGEYVQFNLNEGCCDSSASIGAADEQKRKQIQAVDITGINGGSLMCDNSTFRNAGRALSAKASHDNGHNEKKEEQTEVTGI
jgi:cold shock CspA family protein